jgi:hypothetical protein
MKGSIQKRGDAKCWTEEKPQPYSTYGEDFFEESTSRSLF